MDKYILTEDQLRRAGMLAFENGDPVVRIGIKWEAVEKYIEPESDWPNT